MPVTPTPTDLSPSQTRLLFLRRQEATLLRTKNDAIKRDGLPFYRPHPKQDKFHRSVALRRGVFTGNRFGKSTLGMAEDCAWLRGERPWYPKSDAARTAGIPQRPVKGLLIANDWDKVQEIFTGQDGKLWKFLPADQIKSVHRNHSGAVDTVYCRNRSTLRFDTVKSFMSNPQGSESSDWDFIHVDEPCPENMFKAQARGLIDRNGAAWFTLTALKEPWITDAFEPDGVFYGSSYVVEGSIYDNMEPTGYLSKQAIELYEKTLTPDEKECRLFGKPLFKAGLVYKAFQRDKHVMSELPKGWKSWLEPDPTWSYYLYIDPHPHTPHMVLFVVVDPFGRRYYWADLFDKSLISDLCSKVRLMLAGRRIVRARCDPIAYVDDPINGTNMASEFWRNGLCVEKASKDLSRGILRVNEELQKPTGFPLFSPVCKRTLWEIGRYHWDEETGKPVDSDDHAMECLYRSVLDDPCYVEPQTAAGAVNDIEIATPSRSELFNLDDLPVEEIAVLREHLMLN